MLREEIEQVREICKEEIRLAFGDATPLAKAEAKEAKAQADLDEKEAAEEAKILAREEKEAAKKGGK